jgi:hypothetical protein
MRKCVIGLINVDLQITEVSSLFNATETTSYSLARMRCQNKVSRSTRAPIALKKNTKAAKSYTALVIMGVSRFQVHIHSSPKYDSMKAAMMA